MAAEFVLKRAQPLVESFGGCGAQFNNHVFAPETLAQGVKEASFPELRKKVLKLAPQFVRIFYNDDHAGTPFFDKTAKRSELNRPQSPKQKRSYTSPRLSPRTAAAPQRCGPCPCTASSR